MTAVDVATITIDIEGEPIPQGSMIPVKRGGRIVLISDNPRLAAWRAAVAAAIGARMRLTGHTMLDEPVAVRIDFWLPRPAAAKHRAWPHVRPDVDKMARACLDALTGTAVRDDCLVVDLRAIKHYTRTGSVGARIIVERVLDQGALL